MANPAQISAQDPPIQASVLRKAMINLCDQLAINCKELAVIIGMNEASLSRIYENKAQIDPESKKGELALLLIKLYRSLDTKFDGNMQQCLDWLRHYNHHLQAIPAERILHVEGLLEIVSYLDALFLEDN